MYPVYKFLGSDCKLFICSFILFEIEFSGLYNSFDDFNSFILKYKINISPFISVLIFSIPYGFHSTAPNLPRNLATVVTYIRSREIAMRWEKFFLFLRPNMQKGKK